MNIARLHPGALLALGLLLTATTSLAQAPPEEGTAPPGEGTAPPAEGTAPPAEGMPPPEADSPLARLAWVPGPTTADLGGLATVEVPEGHLFLPGADTGKFLEILGNIPGGQEKGLVLNMAQDWFIVFDFSAEGYVNDDDKDEIDADEILEAMTENNKHGNEARKQRGFTTLTLLGWAREPYYDDKTNHLEWAIKLKDDAGGGVSVNHQTRLLGRRGIMEATLVSDPEKFEAALPLFHGILAKYEFQDGHRYSQFVSGDKVAEYGLTGLMVGGAAVLAAKSGIFKSLWKFIVLGVVAIGALIKKLFNRGSEA